MLLFDELLDEKCLHGCIKPVMIDACFQFRNVKTERAVAGVDFDVKEDSSVVVQHLASNRLLLDVRHGDVQNVICWIGVGRTCRSGWMVMCQ